MHPTLKRAWQVAAAGALVMLACSAQAQDQLNFVSPPDDTEVDLDVEQIVYLRWTRGDRPVAGQSITLETTHGELSDTIVATDLSGFATFYASADTEGATVITASGTGVSASSSLRFVDLGPSKPLGAGFLVPENPNSKMPMLVYTDRIGFRGKPGVDVRAVSAFAAARGLRQLRPLDDDIFVLGFGAPIDRAELRQRASELQQLPNSVVAKAGLVAKLTDAPQWLVIPEEVIVRFRRRDDDGEAARELIKKFAPADVAVTKRDPDRYLLTLSPTSRLDALGITMELTATDAEVVYAEPNYMLPGWLRSHPTPPDHPTKDAGFQWQWHLENQGTYGGMADADVDADMAWHYGIGSHDTTIAIVDRSFDVNHPDLTDNLWTKPPGQKGIDLQDGDGSDLHGSSPNPIQFAHGTRAAGVAAAVGGNLFGYSGACPKCELLLVKTDGEIALFDEAIRDAVDAGAVVISNSWGIFGTFDDIRFAVDYAVQSGVTVVFAISNVEADNCDPTSPDTSSHSQAIAVGGVTDYDQRTEIAGHAMGYGNCVDVVSPTYGGDQGISTTSTKKMASGPPISTYWASFDGTSAATPLVAGVAALLKDINPSLSPIQIQQVLQDTADRVQPGEAYYSAEFGYSNPGGKSTHAYGRINAGEAARLVAPQVSTDESFLGGLGGHDLLLRDHAFDWGNTEQASNTIFSAPRDEVKDYKSVDIKIDVTPYQPQVFTLEEFVNLAPEEPLVGMESRVYVRLRNRGPETVGSPDLKLIWTIVDNAVSYPDLPGDFWSIFPGNHADTSNWQPLDKVPLADMKYSGASVAGCPTRAVPECLPKPPNAPSDAARIAMFTVGAMDWNPATQKGPAFFAVAHSKDDPAIGMTDPTGASLNVLEHVNGDNNVTLWTAGNVPPLVVAPNGPESGECSAQLTNIVLALVGIGLLLALFIILTWSSSPILSRWMCVFLILVLLALLYICMEHPGCISDALSML